MAQYHRLRSPYSPQAGTGKSIVKANLDVSRTAAAKAYAGPISATRAGRCISGFHDIGPAGRLRDKNSRSLLDIISLDVAPMPAGLVGAITGAMAGGAGVPLGGMYRTGGVLKVRLA